MKNFLTKVRYAYGAVIVLMIIAAAVSLWHYHRQRSWYGREKSGLQQIFDDHAKKVNTAPPEFPHDLEAVEN